jgi:hypothetical protein
MRMLVDWSILSPVVWTSGVGRAFVPALAVMLMLGVAACGREVDKPAPSAAGDRARPDSDPGRIEVITGSEVARVVKEAADQERAWWNETRGKIGDLFYDDEVRRRYAERPDIIVSDLRKIALGETGASAESRASASSLLCQFGQVDGWRGLGLLLAGNAGERRAALEKIDYRLENAAAMAGPAERKHVEAGVRQALKASEPEIRELAADASKTLLLDAAQGVTDVRTADAERKAQPPTAGQQPHERTSAFWAQGGRQAKAGLERFQQRGIVDPRLFAQGDLPRAPWTVQATQQVHFNWLLTLSGVKHDFDTEVDDVPSRHDLLIHDLAAITHGRFRPTMVRETFTPKNNDDLETPYKIELVVAERLYRFEAKNLSGWYDVPPVLAALNRALADSQQRERFIALDTGDQTSSIIFGDPREIQLAAAEGWIALSEDADEARRAGQAFEREVEKKLGVSERRP